MTLKRHFETADNVVCAVQVGCGLGIMRTFQFSPRVVCQCVMEGGNGIAANIHVVPPVMMARCYWYRRASGRVEPLEFQEYPFSAWPLVATIQGVDPAAGREGSKTKN